jgi:AraC-like DNA-binding protein
VPVIISFGDPVCVDGHPHSSYVAGMQTQAVITEQSGAQHGVQVDLTPLGARALLGLPMHHLTDHIVPLSDLLDGSMIERLAEAASWRRRFDLLDEVISCRLAEAYPVDPTVRWAYGQLARTKGQVRVGELVEETGWSRQRLADRFRDQVGLTPKFAARILRFQHAGRLLGHRPASEVAAACGYADQAHLSREVRALAGCTPRGLGTTFVQDAVGGPHLP